MSIKTFSGGLYWVKNMYCTDTIIDTFDIQGYIYQFRKEYICPGEKIVFGSHTITQPGEYIDTFANNFSCDTIVHLDVFFKNPPPDSTFVKDTICLHDTIQVGYKKYYQTGVYYDTLRYPSGCDSIYYYIDLLVYKDTTFLYDSVCDYEYSHFFNDSFLFKTIKNCDSIIDYNITNYCPNIVFIPNTFTPDKDGINEIFLPKFVNEHEVTKYSFLVFNRWGESIFETKDIFKGWDGKHESVFSKTGVYIWKIIYTANGETKEVFGHVHLLK